MLGRFGASRASPGRTDHVCCQWGLRCTGQGDPHRAGVLMAACRSRSTCTESPASSTGWSPPPAGSMRTATPSKRGAPSTCTGSSCTTWPPARGCRSEEHTSELQSRPHLVCRLLLEKKKNVGRRDIYYKKNKKERCRN